MSKNWPALIIGIVVSIYWIRVMMMVRRSRKLAGHGANLVPPERLGRLLRFIWVPVIALWILLPFVTFFSRRHFLVPLQSFFRAGPIPLLASWSAAFVAVICLLATFVCWYRMGSSWRMGIDPNDRTQLIFNGPFAFVRHPIYGLSSLLMIATLLAMPSVAMLAVAGIHIALLQWEARREERHLVTLHGEEYQRYARHTGRFFPRSFRAYSGGTYAPSR